MKLQEFTAEDRAQIIHNLFQNAYTERGDYFQLRDLLDYMTNERDYLPWRVLDIQAARMDEVLQYRRTFNSFAVRILNYAIYSYYINPNSEMIYLELYRLFGSIARDFI